MVSRGEPLQVETAFLGLGGVAVAAILLDERPNSACVVCGEVGRGRFTPTWTVGHPNQNGPCNDREQEAGSNDGVHQRSNEAGRCLTSYQSRLCCPAFSF